MKRKLAIGFSVVVGVCVCGPCLVALSPWNSQKGRLDRAIENAEKAGIPLNQKALMAPYVTAESDNAADLIRAAIKLTKNDKELSKKWGFFSRTESSFSKKGDPTPADVRSSVEPILAAWLSASARPKVNFHRDWDLGPNLVFSEFSEIKTAVKGLASAASLETKAGNAAAAEKYLLAGARLAHVTGQEPTLIAMLVQIAGDSIVDRGIQEYVVKFKDRPDTLAAVKRIVAAYGPQPSFRMAMRGECFFGYGIVRSIQTGKFSVKDLGMMGSSDENGTYQPSAGDRAFQGAMSFPLFRNAVLAHTMESYTKMFQDIPKDESDPHVMMIAGANSDQLANADTRPEAILTRILLPVFAQAGSAAVRDVAKRRVIVAAAEVFDIQRRTGQFPTDLPAHGKDTEDPCLAGHKPLIYLRTAKGFKLYSVGIDGIDNGGKPRDPHNSSAPYDEVFEFPVPPKVK